MSPATLTSDFLQHRQELLGFIFALTRDAVVAEEIFQEVALVILREAAAGREVDPFMPWSREIARRRVAEHYRKAGRGAPVPLTEGMVEVVAQAFEENEEPADHIRLRLKYLGECLRRLTARTRDAIEKRYRSRMGIEEIAASMALRADSVNVMLSRARKALADCVRGRLSTAGEV